MLRLNIGLSALLSSELRMLALLWGLGFNKFTGNFTKYLPGKISRECWKSYLDIFTEIDISVLNRACENVPCKLNLWTLILSVHTFWTQGALTLLKDLVKKTNDIKWLIVHCCTIFHLRSGLWNMINTDTQRTIQRSSSWTINYFNCIQSDQSQSGLSVKYT